MRHYFWEFCSGSKKRRADTRPPAPSSTFSQVGARIVDPYLFLSIVVTGDQHIVVYFGAAAIAIGIDNSNHRGVQESDPALDVVGHVTRTPILNGMATNAGIRGESTPLGTTLLVERHVRDEIRVPIFSIV